MIETKKMNEVKMGHCKACNSVIVNIEELDRCPVCKSQFCDYNYRTKVWDRRGYVLFVPPVQASINNQKV
jgi:RNA polymerase subunit RPABC4/transcription elongation factor Spt4